MKISSKLERASENSTCPTYSFEFFPPKTSQGVQNLYDRMDRMYQLGPQFIDITWNAGGRSGTSSTLTCDMVATAQSVYGLETCMHLTCAGMAKENVDNALREAYSAGCQNILALRGDLPQESPEDDGVTSQFRYAKDLIKHIRDTYGDYFDIAVAGYPEGHAEEPDMNKLLYHLKEKVDAGANVIITQMFYDVDRFLDWVDECRQIGITVPIVPGIMPISTYASFMRRARWCEIVVPQEFLDKLESVKEDDVLVRDVGTQLVADMCAKMLDSGKISHLHFYTMNLEKATTMVLERLKALPNPQDRLQPALPWRQSLALGRSDESVRPIFWKNRHQSYVARTQDWDEFPNGRWGDSRSPAFGEVDNFGVGLRLTHKEDPVTLWNHPETLGDLEKLFSHYIEGKVKRLPWSDTPISKEVESIKANLIDLNNRGFLTVNSQPAVNGVKSTHPIHGWGPRNGYVYQKAYLEFFISPSLVEKLIERMNKDTQVTYYCVNVQGDLRSNNSSDQPNAVTWGVFPGKEIVQPTIVETISFLAWKDEAYRLGYDWANMFEPKSKSRSLIEHIMDNWSLVNIVYNDFLRPQAIFDLFNGLETCQLD